MNTINTSVNHGDNDEENSYETRIYSQLGLYPKAASSIKIPLIDSPYNAYQLGCIYITLGIIIASIFLLEHTAGKTLILIALSIAITFFIIMNVLAFIPMSSTPERYRLRTFINQAFFHKPTRIDPAHNFDHDTIS